MTDETMLVDAYDFADVEGLFEDKKGQGGTYLSIFDFAICQRSKSFPSAVEAEANLAALHAVEKGWTGPHERKNPRTQALVYSNSKPYDRMIGRIADISKHTKEFDASKGGGKVTNWDVTILTSGKRLTLQLTWIDHTLKRFLKVAPNIDFSRPLLISAFKAMKNGDAKQAVSFRQYKGDLANKAAFLDIDKWDKVSEYWSAQLVNGERVDGATYSGADGSILPPPIQDEEDDSWDYKAQNKFLAVYFRDNVLPAIKALAEKYGLNNQDTDTSTDNMPLHTGGPIVTDVPVTVKPFNPVAANLGEMVTGAHIARIKQLAEVQGIPPETACQKLVAAGLSELTDEAGRYVIYKLEERLTKQPAAALAPLPLPVTPAPSVVVVPPAVVDDGLWDVGTPPTAPVVAPPAAPVAPATAPLVAYDPESNDDIPW